MRSFLVASFLFALIAVARPAAADGKRDLEDGIAFYENLDTERALERLSAASKAGDLSQKDRARAFLYLGMTHFENANRDEAAKAWKSAFELERNVEIPQGTSPKTIEAIEAARATTPKAQDKDEPGNRPKDTPDIQQKKDLPKVNEQHPPDPNQQNNANLTTTAKTTKPDDDDDTTTWLIIGGIGAAVIGAAIVGIIVARGGSECEGNGGCVSVSFQ